jgi:hypothetical protein
MKNLVANGLKGKGPRALVIVANAKSPACAPDPPQLIALFGQKHRVCNLEDVDFIHCELLRAPEEVGGGIIREYAVTPASGTCA